MLEPIATPLNKGCDRTRSSSVSAASVSASGRQQSDMARRIRPLPEQAKRALWLIDEAQYKCEVYPGLAVGLVILCLALGLPRRSAIALWSVSRAAGQIAHVLEQCMQGVVLRPRALHRQLALRHFTPSRSAVHIRKRGKEHPTCRAPPPSITARAVRSPFRSQAPRGLPQARDIRPAQV
jgi:hypothetical protein